MSKEDLFPPAAPDFNDPLGLLRACHERILQHCDTLEKLIDHLAENGVDQAAREAAAQVHRYFSVAGKHHHEDEEQDLFPRLARQSLKLADVVHHLKQEHQQIDSFWSELAPLLAKPSALEDATSFREPAERFIAAQRAHVLKENSDLLEMAQHIFSTDELKSIGQAMAERRGVKQPV